MDQARYFLVLLLVSASCCLGWFGVTSAGALTPAFPAGIDRWAPPSIAGAPLSLPEATTQLITVRTPSAGSTSGTLTAWQRDPAGQWQTVLGPVAAEVGSSGVGHASEGSDTTPEGTHALDQAFGREPDPGTAMPYLHTDELDWWDENPASPTYNEHVRQSASPGGASENLFDSGSVYDYAVNIAYNTARVPGAGSAFFLHVSQGEPTAGCVAVPRANMETILKWLDPARDPMISIEVGAAWVPPAVAPTQATSAPSSAVQAVSASPLRIQVLGWAADPARFAVPVDLRARVKGPSGPEVSILGKTGAPSSGSPAPPAWAGPLAGFGLFLPARSPGPNRVCVDVMSGTKVVATLGCRTVQVVSLGRLWPM